MKQTLVARIDARLLSQAKSESVRREVGLDYIVERALTGYFAPAKPQPAPTCFIPCAECGQLTADPAPSFPGHPLCPICQLAEDQANAA